MLLLLLLPVSCTTNQAVRAAKFDAFPKLMPQIDGHVALDTDSGYASLWHMQNILFNAHTEQTMQTNELKMQTND